MTETITDDVRQWITQAFEAGHSVASLINRLVASGWTDLDARKALRGALCDGGAPEVVSRQPPTTAIELPEPTSLQAPFVVLDRKVRILLSLRHPRVILFGDLLSAEECGAIIGMARGRMVRSRTVDNETGGEITHESRTSRGMFFDFAENEVIARVETRIATLLNWPLERGEGIQVLRYDAGAEYKPHHDYFVPGEPGTPAMLKRGGQRVGSLVMYLNEPELGGATIFPEVGIEISPHRGNALFFSYPCPDVSTKTLHGGAPVVAGEKWVATKWFRAGKFW